MEYTSPIHFNKSRFKFDFSLGHFSSESSAQNASAFIEALDFHQEIIVNQEEHPFAYPSFDTVGQITEMVANATKHGTGNDSNLQTEKIDSDSTYKPTDRWHFEKWKIVVDL